MSNMAKVVSNTTGVEESVVASVLGVYMDLALLHMMFQGPLETALGRMEVVDGKVTITNQSKKVSVLLNSGIDQDQLTESVKTMLGSTQ